MNSKKRQQQKTQQKKTTKTVGSRKTVCFCFFLTNKTNKCETNVIKTKNKTNKKNGVSTKIKYTNQNEEKLTKLKTNLN